MCVAMRGSEPSYIWRSFGWDGEEGGGPKPLNGEETVHMQAHGRGQGPGPQCHAICILQLQALPCFNELICILAAYTMRTSKYQVLDDMHAMSQKNIRERPHRPHVMGLFAGLNFG